MQKIVYVRNANWWVVNFNEQKNGFRLKLDVDADGRAVFIFLVVEEVLLKEKV